MKNLSDAFGERLLHVPRPMLTKKIEINTVCNMIQIDSQCLKIAQKVAFNSASEASYVYFLSGQKLIKTAKNYPFWRVFENSVTRQVTFIRTKIGEKYQN